MEKVNIKIEGAFSDLPCIYRMQMGKTKKFFIWKTKSLKPSLPTMAKDLQRKIDKGCNDQDVFCKLASYMRANRVRNITVKVLVETADLVRIIHKEHELLSAAAEDSRNCLNNIFLPYLPGWIKNELDEEDLGLVVGFVCNPPIPEGIMKQVEGDYKTDYSHNPERIKKMASKFVEPDNASVNKVTAPSFFAPPKGTYLIPKGIIDGEGPDNVEYKEITPASYDGPKKEEEDPITLDDIRAISAKLKSGK